MKIALIGATGYVGSRILTEALDRNHQVTAIARDLKNLPVHDNLTAVRTDATDRQTLAETVAGHDLVINAFNPALDEDGSGTQSIIAGVKQGGITRFLTVGGAGTLLLPSGEQVVDQPRCGSRGRTGRPRVRSIA